MVRSIHHGMSDGHPPQGGRRRLEKTSIKKRGNYTPIMNWKKPFSAITRRIMAPGKKKKSGNENITSVMNSQRKKKSLQKMIGDMILMG